MLALVLSAALLAQDPTPGIPARDATKPRGGTGVIAGVVTGADGVPLRRAVVSINGSVPLVQSGPMSGPPTTRVVATNLEGYYEFTGLPSGRYQLRVTPGAFRGQYTEGTFGGGPTGGKPIELTEGERFTANVTLGKAGAVNGRVVDDFGEPVARAMVFASRAVGGAFARVGVMGQTDDLGRFRLYGLQPADYVVAAETRGMGGPPVEGESENFVTTYHPAALTEKEATRIRVAAGTDAGEVLIQMVRTRTFKITGTVVDSQGQLVTRPQISLVRATGISGFSSNGMQMDQSGRFMMRDVLPGEYRIIVRPSTGMSYGPQQPGPAPAAPQEYASVAVNVSGDIDDIVIQTSRGSTVTGEVVFAEGPPAVPPPNLRVMAQPGDRLGMMGASPSATVDSSLQFTLNELFGPMLIRLSGVPRGYVVKQVLHGSADVTDTPVEFRDRKRVQIVLTSRVSTIEGLVTDDAGQPAANGGVLIIPEDKASWRQNASRLRAIRGLKDGRFSVGSLLAGRYYVLAVPLERLPFVGETPLEYFEELVKEATVVILGEDDKRQVDLRMMKGPER